MNWIKKMGLRLGLVLFSVLFAVGLVEILIRIFFPQFAPCGEILIKVNAEGVELARKNYVGRQYDNQGEFNVSVKINQYGFRDSRDLADSDSRNIFVVGDSFTFGWCVEEEKRFSDVLQRLLGEKVYNIAIPTEIDGYGRLIDYAQRQGAKIGRLVCAVCMENDLVDYEAADRSKAVRNTIVKARESHILNKFKPFLNMHFATYRLVVRAVHSHPLLKDLALKLRLRIDPITGLNRYKGLNEPVLYSSARYLKKITAPYSSTIVIIPSRALWIGGNENMEHKVHDRFIQILKEEGMDVVDLLPAFEKDGDPNQYHLKFNGHWNEKGHQKAAEIIAEHLRETVRQKDWLSR